MIKTAIEFKLKNVNFYKLITNHMTYDFYRFIYAKKLIYKIGNYQLIRAIIFVKCARKHTHLTNYC